MQLAKDDIELLRAIVEKTLEEFRKDEKKVFRPGIQLIAAEEKYEEALVELLEKLK